MQHLRIATNVLGLMMLLFALAACKPQIEELSFETIAQGDGFYTGRGYGEEKPALLVIASPEEADKPGLDVQFPSELADQLRTLDYTGNFVALVLQGQKRSTGYAVTVKQIVRQGNQVAIDAEFVEPLPGTRRNPAFTSPYHLVAIVKDGQWGQEVKFVLVVNGATVAETTHFIP